MTDAEELRLTDDEEIEGGASSAKGIIYIRYGPLKSSGQLATALSIEPWFYYDEMLRITFRQMRMYRTSSLLSVVYDGRIDLENDRAAIFKNLSTYATESKREHAGCSLGAPEDSADLAVLARTRTGAVR